MLLKFVVIKQYMLDLRRRVYTLQTYFSHVELAVQWQWEPRWLPNYIHWPSSGPLVDMNGLSSEEVSCHQLPSRGWLLEARTSEVEIQVEQRRPRG